MKRKFTALLLPIVLVASMMLSGCVAQIGEIEIKSDFTGSYKLSAGYTAEALDLVSAAAGEENEIDKSELDEFTHNGITYYGEAASTEFSSIDELNDISINAFSADAIEIVKFTEEQDGSVSFALVLNGKVEIETSEAEQAQLDEETKIALEKMVDEMAVVIDIAFPSDIKQVAGIESDAISISENKLNVDLLKLSNEIGNKREAFIFASPDVKNVPTVRSITGFDDVYLNDWFFSQVVKMADAGLFNGKQVGKFCPKDTMTKAEFITVVARTVFDEETIDGIFESGNIWWTKYYNACLDANLFTEEQIPRMGLDETITREEMALIACGYLKNVEYGDIQEYDMNSVAQFIPDYQQIDPEMLQSAIHCYSEGIICGADDKGSFMPKKTLTRAEASTVLYRLINSDARQPANIDILQ